MIKLKYFTVPILLFYFCIGLLILNISGCSLFKKKYEKRETKDYIINSTGKKKISLSNLSGNVKVSKNTADSLIRIKTEIVAYVTKKELNEPLENIKMKIDTTGSVVDISSESYSERKFFKFSINNKSNKINYDISIPDMLEVSIDNTSGKIIIEDLNSDVKVDLVSGNISLKDIYGKVNLDVTNGKIDGDLDSTKGLDINTVNGSITLNLGSSFAGNFKADCVNGKVITKDLTFQRTEESKKSFEGTLGSSNIDVKLETVNGKIYLNKR
jgi:DUF4097 and DUF4098 domain-containing protein YvlB